MNLVEISLIIITSLRLFHHFIKEEVLDSNGLSENIPKNFKCIFIANSYKSKIMEMMVFKAPDLKTMTVRTV